MRNNLKETVQFENFLREATKPQEVEEIKIVAAESSKEEEACEHAKTYWLLGWTWEEISAALEDMEFPEKMVDKAIKEAQVYAIKIINDGPFSGLKQGQLVKMVNGTIAQVSSIHKDMLYALDTQAGCRLEVLPEQLDKNASLVLKEAHALRCSVYQLITAAPETEDVNPLDFWEPEKQLDIKTPDKMTVIPEPTETLDVRVQERAPAGWGELTPEMSMVNEVSEITSQALSTLAAAELELQTVKADLTTLNSMAKEIRTKQKELSQKKATLAKEVFALVGQENAALNDLNVTVFQQWKGKLVGLQRTIVEIPQEPGVFDELNALKEILATTAPEISSQVLETLEGWKKANTTILEQIHETFAMYPPPKGKAGKTIEESKVLVYANSSLESVQDSVNDLYAEVFPVVEYTNEAIDAFTNKMTNFSVASKVKKAFNVC